jgi:hypothetical protein
VGDWDDYGVEPPPKPSLVALAVLLVVVFAAWAAAPYVAELLGTYG